ncbi:MULTISPECIES: LysR substrate-binding domain-containing protein [unclassified Ruegeria]|uniref:LysR substrate-binding domain-containing protein n=1 Tax=Ruegeria sp. HKCCC2111 TaxID=2682990 RepID=UPI001487C04E|nr:MULTISPECIES: LysR substrate-binding domain-containing protein [unclassified Ruegeria]
MIVTRPIPLHQINAFDASARHLSFSRAARELNVQQPAISRQIAALEAELGTQLFLRSKPKLTLTEDGALLAKAVGAGFEAIRDGFEALQSRHAVDTLKVSASIGFTSHYLLPRLAEFQATFPDVKLQVMTRDQNDDFDPNACDVVILFGEGGLAQTVSGLIFKESMIAVCHPDLLDNRAPFNLQSLSEQKLLHLNSADHRGDWNRFFAGTGLVISQPPPHDTYVSYMVYLRAILNGLGVGIGWYPLMREYLTNGSLVRACDHERETSRGYFCSVTPSGAGKAGAAQFLDWIVQSDRNTS